MDKKLNLVLDTMSVVNKIDNMAYKFLNDRLYENMASPLKTKIEDLCFHLLFDNDYDSLDNKFATPGMSDLEKRGRVVIWDKGYPLETINECLLNCNNENMATVKKKLKKQVKLVKKALKEHKKINN